jgi:hypothetical protein
VTDITYTAHSCPLKADSGGSDVTSEGAIGVHAEAVLIRKRPHQKCRTVVMRGRVEQLIRYVFSTPTAHHKEYRLVCGGQEYGLGRMEALARELKINGPAHIE